MGCGDEGWSEKGGKDSQREVVRDRAAGVVRRWPASWASGDLSLSGSEGNSQAGARRWGVLAGGGLVGFGFPGGFGTCGPVCCERGRLAPRSPRSLKMWALTHQGGHLEGNGVALCL